MLRPVKLLARCSPVQALPPCFCSSRAGEHSLCQLASILKDVIRNHRAELLRFFLFDLDQRDLVDDLLGFHGCWVLFPADSGLDAVDDFFLRRGLRDLFAGALLLVLLCKGGLYFFNLAVLFDSLLDLFIFLLLFLLLNLHLGDALLQLSVSRAVLGVDAGVAARVPVVRGFPLAPPAAPVR